MATKSSIHIKPCNIASSEAHNRRTAEARVYPLLVIGSQFGYNVDSGLADIAHVLGSSPVMSPA